MDKNKNGAQGKLAKKIATEKKMQKIEKHG